MKGLRIRDLCPYLYPLPETQKWAHWKLLLALIICRMATQLHGRLEEPLLPQQNHWCPRSWTWCLESKLAVLLNQTNIVLFVVSNDFILSIIHTFEVFGMSCSFNWVGMFKLWISIVRIYGILTYQSYYGWLYYRTVLVILRNENIIYITSCWCRVIYTADLV